MLVRSTAEPGGAQLESVGNGRSWEGRWPLSIDLSNKVEVVVQHMTSRPPFDDIALRDEFRQRLSQRLSTR